MSSQPCSQSCAKPRRQARSCSGPAGQPGKDRRAPRRKGEKRTVIWTEGSRTPDPGGLRAAWTGPASGRPARAALAETRGGAAGRALPSESAAGCRGSFSPPRGPGPSAGLLEARLGSARKGKGVQKASTQQSPARWPGGAGVCARSRRAASRAPGCGAQARQASRCGAAASGFRGAEPPPQGASGGAPAPKSLTQRASPLRRVPCCGGNRQCRSTSRANRGRGRHRGVARATARASPARTLR